MKQVPDAIALPLYATCDEFLRDGRETKVDEIARVSGVPRATLYYYFAGKDDILAFVVIEKFRRAGQRIAEARKQQGTAADRLTALLRAIVEEMGQYPKTWTAVLAALAGSAQFDGVLAVADEVTSDPIVELLAEGRAQGEFTLGDSDLRYVASALYGAITFAGMRAIRRTGELDLDALVSSVVIPFIRGLQTDTRRKGSP
jgi:TetR/AcrR family transcriptional regulator